MAPHRGRRQRQPMSDTHKEALGPGAKKAAPCAGTSRPSSTSGRGGVASGPRSRCAGGSPRWWPASRTPIPWPACTWCEERADLEAELTRVASADDVATLEKAFVKVARAYGERKGIAYNAWRAAGVTSPSSNGRGSRATRGRRPPPRRRRPPSADPAATADTRRLRVRPFPPSARTPGRSSPTRWATASRAGAGTSQPMNERPMNAAVPGRPPPGHREVPQATAGPPSRKAPDRQTAAGAAGGLPIAEAAATSERSSTTPSVPPSRASLARSGCGIRPDHVAPPRCRRRRCRRRSRWGCRRSGARCGPRPGGRCQGGGVAGVVALEMVDRDAQLGARAARGGEDRARGAHPHPHRRAQEAQVPVLLERAGEEAGLGQHLEAVADPDHGPAVGARSHPPPP